MNIEMKNKRHWFKTFLWKVRIVLSSIFFGGLACRAKNNRMIRAEVYDLLSYARQLGEAKRAKRIAKQKRIEELTLALEECTTELKKFKRDNNVSN